ncbi:hypothetical protein [Actinomadura roseirufa]|uniref:hypothetical protein n=1 Tax=Actinomadura roseirufa TaxID=2094049 RepID=UPI0010419B74|nr:hypothetical protein [Actinomadura roseirufa]
MRHTRVTAAVALAATLASCTTGKHTPSFNPTPKPTHPGQVVIIAGDPNIHRPPRDGEYALRASAHSNGGLALDQRTGAVYFPVTGEMGKVVARLERNGSISALPIGIGADQLFAAGGQLWMMLSSAGVHLVKVNLSTLEKTDVLGADGEARTRFEVLDPLAKVVSTEERDELGKHWKGSLFTIRGDGVPVLISSAGQLFEVVGRNALRRWRPQGYEKALSEAAPAPFQPTGLIPDGRRGIVTLGHTGLLRVGDDGASRGFRFPATVQKMPPWTEMAPLSNGSILLLGGVSALEQRPRPTLLKLDGSLESLSFGTQKKCDDFNGSMAAVASAKPTGMVKSADGAYVMGDKYCGLIYSFRLPDHISG